MLPTSFGGRGTGSSPAAVEAGERGVALITERGEASVPLGPSLCGRGAAGAIAAKPAVSHGCRRGSGRGYRRGFGGGEGKKNGRNVKTTGRAPET